MGGRSRKADGSCIDVFEVAPEPVVFIDAKKPGLQEGLQALRVGDVFKAWIWQSCESWAVYGMGCQGRMPAIDALEQFTRGACVAQRRKVDTKIIRICGWEPSLCRSGSGRGVAGRQHCHSCVGVCWAKACQMRAPERAYERLTRRRPRRMGVWSAYQMPTR